MKLFALLLLFLASCSAPTLLRYEKPIVKYSKSNYLTIFENKNNLPSYVYLKVLDSAKDKEIEVLGYLPVKKSTMQKRFVNSYNLIKLDGNEVFVYSDNLYSMCEKTLSKLTNEIIVGKDSIDIYWSRAVNYIASNPRNRFNVQTDLLIDTYIDPIQYSNFGYSITKEFLKDGNVKITSRMKTNDKDYDFFPILLNYYILYGTTCY